MPKDYQSFVDQSFRGEGLVPVTAGSKNLGSDFAIGGNTPPVGGRAAFKPSLTPKV